MWVEDSLHESEKPFTAVHEFVETRVMADGRSYDQAHDLAAQVEWNERRLGTGPSMSELTDDWVTIKLSEIGVSRQGLRTMTTAVKDAKTRFEVTVVLVLPGKEDESEIVNGRYSGQDGKLTNIGGNDPLKVLGQKFPSKLNDAKKRIAANPGGGHADISPGGWLDWEGYRKGMKSKDVSRSESWKIQVKLLEGSKVLATGAYQVTSSSFRHVDGKDIFQEMTALGLSDEAGKLKREMYREPPAGTLSLPGGKSATWAGSIDYPEAYRNGKAKEADPHLWAPLVDFIRKKVDDYRGYLTAIAGKLKISPQVLEKYQRKLPELLMVFGKKILGTLEPGTSLESATRYIHQKLNETYLKLERELLAESGHNEHKGTELKGVVPSLSAIRASYYKAATISQVISGANSAGKNKSAIDRFRQKWDKNGMKTPKRIQKIGDCGHIQVGERYTIQGSSIASLNGRTCTARRPAQTAGWFYVVVENYPSRGQSYEVRIGCDKLIAAKGEEPDTKDDQPEFHDDQPAEFHDLISEDKNMRKTVFKFGGLPGTRFQDRVDKSMFSKAGREVVNDAAEFMEEHAEEENLNKRQKAAVKYHAKCLKEISGHRKKAIGSTVGIPAVGATNPKYYDVYQAGLSILVRNKIVFLAISGARDVVEFMIENKNDFPKALKLLQDKFGTSAVRGKDQSVLVLLNMLQGKAEGPDMKDDYPEPDREKGVSSEYEAPRGTIVNIIFSEGKWVVVAYDTGKKVGSFASEYQAGSYIVAHGLILNSVYDGKTWRSADKDDEPDLKPDYPEPDRMAPGKSMRNRIERLRAARTNGHAGKSSNGTVDLSAVASELASVIDGEIALTEKFNRLSGKVKK